MLAIALPRSEDEDRALRLRVASGELTSAGLILAVWGERIEK